MEIDEIKKVIVKNKKVIFGAEPEALHEIEVDSLKKQIKIYSDNGDYLMPNKAEEIMKKLSQEFDVGYFSIDFLYNKGKILDETITLNIKEEKINETPSIINYIMNNFFKKIKWRYISR
jgi:hypothetical protein